MPTSIAQLPLAFVRSGSIALANGQANNVGSRGYVWSRMPLSSTVAYDLTFYTGVINPSYTSDRYGGFPLR